MLPVHTAPPALTGWVFLSPQATTKPCLPPGSPRKLPHLLCLQPPCLSLPKDLPFLSLVSGAPVPDALAHDNAEWTE